MKIQATFALIIFAALVGWLFYHAHQERSIQEQQLRLESRRVDLAEREEQRLLGEQSRDRYEIINDPDGQTYLLNVQTGETWRWYRNLNKETSEIESEGWAPVVFTVGILDYAESGEARLANKRRQEIVRDRRQQEHMRKYLPQPGGDASGSSEAGDEASQD